MFVWGGAAPNHMRPLKTAQNFKIKLISGQPRLHAFKFGLQETENSTCRTAVHEATTKFLQKKLDGCYGDEP